MYGVPIPSLTGQEPETRQTSEVDNKSSGIKRAIPKHIACLES